MVDLEDAELLERELMSVRHKIWQLSDEALARAFVIVIEKANGRDDVPSLK